MDILSSENRVGAYVGRTGVQNTSLKETDKGKAFDALKLNLQDKNVLSPFQK